MGEYQLGSRKLASGRRSACCTYKGYNENSVEARYGVMRSAKRTQTYWLAWCRGRASGGGGGRGTPLARRGTPPTSPVPPSPPRRRLNSRHYFNTTTMRTYTTNFRCDLHFSNYFKLHHSRPQLSIQCHCFAVACEVGIFLTFAVVW